MSPLIVADSFLRAASQLESSEKARVLEFVSGFHADPTSPGINLERLTGSARHLWSGRVNQDIRAILHQDGDTWALLYVDHHQPAYQWAERKKVSRHPVTGSLQVVETIESIQEVPVYQASELEGAAMFHGYEDSYLVSLGVPESWLPAVRQVRTEEHLLAVGNRLPEDVWERLIRLADGEMVSPPDPIGRDQPPTASPDTRRRFFLVEDGWDIRSALEAPLEKWIAFLHPSQREIVEGEFSGPVKVSGAAGTGKTVVALHRARWLARRGHRVLLTSYVNSLCNNLRRNLGLFCKPEELDLITVSTVHSQALDLVRSAGQYVTPARDRVVEGILDGVASELSGDFESRFVRADWDNVIQIQGIDSWREYREASRTGRGRPLTVEDRRRLWSVFEEVRERLSDRGLVDWARLTRTAARAVEEGAVAAPYDAVVVDEVQDLKPPELRLIRALAADHEDRLMVVGDAGQRIYPGGYSLKSLGIDVRGRAHVLRLNYRTTQQIQRAAELLLDGEVDDLDGDVESRGETQSLIRGPEPTLLGFDSLDQEAEGVALRITSWLEDGLTPSDIGVFARTRRQLKDVAALLDDAGVRSVELRGDESSTDAVGLGTMHGAKGLEFKAVCVTGCSADELPNRYTLEQASDPADRDAAWRRERRLLYVAMTRARDELAVTWAGEPSEFLVPVIAAHAS